MLEYKINIIEIKTIISVMSHNVLLYFFAMFLIVVKSASGYDDSYEAPSYRRTGHHLREEPRWKKDRHRKHSMRLEYDYDKVPVEFDVANFIKSDDDMVEEDQDFDHRNDILRESNDYDYDALTNQDAAIKKSDEISDEDFYKNRLIKNSLDNFNVGMLGMSKLENFKNPYEMENTGHNAEKKCILKKVTFPFFSHKSELPSGSAKKEKKRKLFSFRKCSKKKDEKGAGVKSSHAPDKITHFAQPIKSNKIKRSYIQKLCPECKKKFLDTTWHMKRRKKKNNNNFREFYENLPDEQLNQNDMVTRQGEEDDAEGDFHRERRSQEADARVREMENREQIRERQLKELDEVQKEIDEVEIHMPQISAPRSKVT